MMALFEQVTAQPYPWDKYAQAVLWNFGAGGMENTSATSLHESAIVSREALLDHDPDGLIAHELAHQWFGDLVTCNSWEHIWLNEGFATYFESLWLERRDGVDGYYTSMLADFDGVIGADRVAAPEGSGMASKVYVHPWEAFRRPANPYGKGASVLHMLRTGLGDDLFFKGVALYLNRRSLKTTETIDLRTALEDVSGKDLRQFFHQWVTRPQIPRLDVVTRFTGSDLEVSVTQNQVIDGDNPAFEFAMPLALADSGGNLTLHRVAVTQRTKTARIPCGSQPLYVAIDPWMALLAEFKIQQPLEAWREQALRGPTLPSRVQALRALRQMRDAGSAELALQVAQSNFATVVRVQAVNLLGEVGTAADMVKIASPDVDRWEVREAACRGLAEMIAQGRAGAQDRNAAVSALEMLASRDPSTKVRVAALIGAAQTGSSQAEAMTAQALQSDSQDDRMRQAALDVMAIRRVPGSLRKAIALTGPQYAPRTRAKAASVVVQLADQDREAAFAALDSLVRSTEVRTRLGAGQALVDLGDERAMATFDSLLGSEPTFDVRWRINSWKSALKQRLGR
jgi:aminopeptidase N